MKYPNQIKKKKIVGKVIYENQSGQNRKDRRAFAKKTGIKMKGVNKPYINPKNKRVVKL